MDKKCLNCFYINFLASPMVCSFHGTDEITLDWTCPDWYPNQTIEIQILSKENAELKTKVEELQNENLAIPHLLEYNKELEEKTQWISVSERLPERPLYDWVLVAVKLVPENWYGVPHIAELRSGVWYSDGHDTPLEATCGVSVTHWMPLPEPPKEGD